MLQTTTNQAAEVFAANLNDLCKRLQPALSALAGGTSFSVAVVPGGPTCFDHEAQQVRMSAEDLFRWNSDSYGTSFVIGHEVSHLAQLASDPKGYLSFIEAGEKDPALFRFYNALLDVQGNRWLAHNAATFAGRSTPFSAQIESLYENKLFGACREPGTLEADPLHAQFGYMLLLHAMGVSGAFEPDPRVRDALSDPIECFGQKLSPIQALDLYLTPTALKSANIPPMERLKYIVDTVFRPIFERLREIDTVEERKDRPDNTPGHGTPEPLISPEVAREIARAIGRGKDSRERSPSAREIERNREQAEEIGKAAGLERQDAKGFGERFADAAPIASAIGDIWRQLRTRNTEANETFDGPFPTGDRLSVPAILSQLDTLVLNPGALLPFERRVETTQEVVTQRSITIRLVLDLSGSMSCDVEKLQTTALALGASLFGLEQESAFAPTGEQIMAALQIVGFGDEMIPILEPTPHPDLETLARVFPKFVADSLSTRDTGALNEILRTVGATNNEIDPRNIDILVEITDGQVENPTLSQSLLKQLSDRGLHLVGIRFARGNDDAGDFNRMWATLPGRSYVLNSSHELTGALLDAFRSVIESDRHHS